MVRPNWILQRTRLSYDKVALIDLHTNKSWTYASLEREIMKWISFIQQHELKRGDRLVIVSSNRIELFPIIFACGVMGIIYVPLNYRLSIKELNELIQDSQAAILLYDEPCKDIADHLLIDVIVNIYAVELLTSEPI